MVVLELFLCYFESGFESPICFSDPYMISQDLVVCSSRHTLHSPLVQCLEWIGDLAQSLELDMGLSRGFTSLPIGFHIFKLVR